jgi:CheY-like chemotaxis protein
MRVRPKGAASYGPIEVATTVDVSRLGMLFVTLLRDYSRDMAVQVTFPYSQGFDGPQTEQEGRVVRVTELSHGRRAVAIALGSPEANQDCGPVPGQREEAQSTAIGHAAGPDQSGEPKPIILVLDSQADVLETIKTLLNDEGYEIIAVNNAADAREVLRLFTPAMVIAEIEGEGFPGYDLCAHVKATARLRRVPVVLTTCWANPSDYSGAHSLGAVVCMAKPFRKERLLHVARLLAPLKNHKS